MSDSITATAEYHELLDSIKRTIAAGRLRAARAVNNVIIETYWAIGQDIVARQQEQGWGGRVITRPRTCGQSTGGEGPVAPEPRVHGDSGGPLAAVNRA